MRGKGKAADRRPGDPTLSGPASVPFAVSRQAAATAEPA